MVGTLIGHHVVLATLNHDFASEYRSSMIPAPIIIGKNVWIGSNSTVLPGVTIGDNAIVAAGVLLLKMCLSTRLSAEYLQKLSREYQNNRKGCL